MNFEFQIDADENINPIIKAKSPEDVMLKIKKEFMNVQNSCNDLWKSAGCFF